MKKSKNILMILLIILISAGGFGCMKGNNNVSSEEIKMNMLQYAEDKYDEHFDVVDFNLAIRGLDSNYHDVLVLKNDSSVKFNVYSNTNTNECFDDYGMSVSDKKIYDYIKESSGLDFTLMADLLAEDLAEDQILPADVNSLSALEIMDNYEIGTVIVVVRVDDIEDNIEELYQLYQMIVSLNSDSIDFEVVSSNGNDEKLDKVFNNIRLDYENDWSQYSSINKFISATDQDLTMEQFEMLIEEV